MTITYHGGNIIRGTAADRTGGTWTNLQSGYLFIESDTQLIYYWNGTAWSQIGGIPNQPYNYLVYTSGGTTYVKNGLTETITHSGSTVATEIQWALDNLTASRTNKETVVLHGNFTTATRLDISSYTRLIVDGTIKMANGITTQAAILRNKNYGTSVDSNIEICGGGIIDGNVANASSCHGILLDGTTDFSIHDLSVKNMGAPSGRGIYITTTNSGRVSRRGSIYSIVCDGNTDSGIEFSGTSDGVDATGVHEMNISNVWSINSVSARGFCLTNLNKSHFVNCHAINNLGSSGRGYDCSYGSYDNDFTNCYAELNNLDGFTVADSPTAPPSDRNHFTNCQSRSNTLFGFNVSADDCTFVGCISDSNIQDGFRISYNNNHLIGCIAKNNSQVTGNTYNGIDVRGTNNIVTGCKCYDTQTTKTQKNGMITGSSSANNLFIGNQLYNNIQNPYTDAGTANVWVSNYGALFTDFIAMTAPTNPATGTTRKYAKTIDSNNDGLFYKTRVNGAVVEVAI